MQFQCRQKYQKMMHKHCKPDCPADSSFAKSLRKYLRQSSYKYIKVKNLNPQTKDVYKSRNKIQNIKQKDKKNSSQITLFKDHQKGLFNSNGFEMDLNKKKVDINNIKQHRQNYYTTKKWRQQQHNKLIDKYFIKLDKLWLFEGYNKKRLKSTKRTHQKSQKKSEQHELQKNYKNYKNYKYINEFTNICQSKNSMKAQNQINLEKVNVYMQNIQQQQQKANVDKPNLLQQMEALKYNIYDLQNIVNQFRLKSELQTDFSQKIQQRQCYIHQSENLIKFNHSGLQKQSPNALNYNRYKLMNTKFHNKPMIKSEQTKNICLNQCIHRNKYM